VSEATLTVREFPISGMVGRRVEVDCAHATTGVTTLVPPWGLDVSESDMARVALATHYGEEGCSCTAALWREHWGAPLGELVLVKGTP